MDDDAVSPLAGCYLTHSHTPGLLPFRSIMDLPCEEALLMEEAFLYKCSPRDTDPATRIASYYRHRVEVEDWLRGEAAGLGVAIRARNPVYFRLTREAGRGRRADTRHVSLPIESIDLACCSFTVGDSFPNRLRIENADYESPHMTRHEFLGRVMKLDDTASVVAGLAALGNQPDDYIEVQMWDRPAMPH